VDGHEPKKMLEQVTRAIKKRVGVDLPDAGYAIEIAFGDHVEVAKEALRLFKAAGLKEPLLIASGALDEWRISEIRRDEPRFAAFAVDSLLPTGTTRIARYDLVAMEDEGRWQPRFRLGESLLASTSPGRKKVLRYIDAEGHPACDIIHAANERIQPAKDARFLHRATGLATRMTASSSAPLHAPVMRDGKRASAPEPAREGRARAQAQVASLRDPHKRLTRPSPFPVGVSPALAILRDELAGAGKP
jgi:nicotinate phosphoribosyltransferase